MEEHNHYFKGRIPPPIFFLTFLIIGLTAHWIFPIDFILHKWSIRLFIGMPMIILSGIIAFTAIVAMRKNRTSVSHNKPTIRIVTDGSFHFSRNPLYLSLLLTFGSVAVFTNSVWLLSLLVLLFVTFNYGIVVREEHYLEKCFGEEYIQYKNKVRRWL